MDRSRFRKSSIRTLAAPSSSNLGGTCFCTSDYSESARKQRVGRAEARPSDLTVSLALPCEKIELPGIG